MRRAEAEWTAIVVIAILLGTIPMAGGYSNTRSRAVSGKPARVLRKVSSDFTTVGIVTQVEGNAFAVAQNSLTGEALAVGRGVLAGDCFWVERASLVRLSDTEGNRLVIAGPALAQFVRRDHAPVVRVVSGSFKFRATEGRGMRFENAFVAGEVAGEGALWASETLVQIAGLSGRVRAWHPRLESARTEIEPGFFSEASPAFHQLQPQKPIQVEVARLEGFLARFDEPGLEARGLASVDKPAAEPLARLRGSRAPAEIVEARNEGALARLRAHLVGESVDDERLAPRKLARAPGKAQYDVWGQPIRSRKEREN